MAHGEFVQDPIHAATLQGGFSREKGGNLRDHDGCKAGPGTMSTTHYDGDYGPTPPTLAGAASGQMSGSDSAASRVSAVSGSDSAAASGQVRGSDSAASGRALSSARNEKLGGKGRTY